MYSLECWRTVALCNKTSNMPFMTSLAFSPQNSQVSKSTPKQARRILDEVKKNNLLALVNESSRVLIFRDKKGAKIHKKVHFSDCKHGVDRSGFQAQGRFHSQRKEDLIKSGKRKVLETHQYDLLKYHKCHWGIRYRQAFMCIFMAMICMCHHLPASKLIHANLLYSLIVPLTLQYKSAACVCVCVCYFDQGLLVQQGNNVHLQIQSQSVICFTVC